MQKIILNNPLIINAWRFTNTELKHGKTRNIECLQETVLQSFKHIDEQSKLKYCHHKKNDKRLEEAGDFLQNTTNLELSLAMDGMEIPWKDLILKEQIGVGSFGTMHHADWHGSGQWKIALESHLLLHQITWTLHR